MITNESMSGLDPAFAAIPLFGKAGGRLAGIAEKAGIKIADRSPRIASKTMRSQWLKFWREKTGNLNLTFPTTESGKNWVVHHAKHLVDGGKNIAENYMVMPSWEHVDWHMLQGDFARWVTKSN